MWGSRKGTGRGGDLERRLRAARPEAPPQLVEALISEVSHAERPRVWSRLAFAAAFTTLLVGMFASFGGVGYTTSATSHAYQTVKNLSAAKPVRVHSAADAQYPGSPANEVAPANTNQAAGAVVEQQQGTLPFTGISLLATVLVALALIALGFALRSRERRNV